MVRGREIDLAPYYPCPWCGANKDALIQLDWAGDDPVMPGLLTGDGVVMLSLRSDLRYFQTPLYHDALLTREVGRVHCRDERRISIDHVYFDWCWIDRPGDPR